MYKKLINVVIPAAGAATRLRPLSSNTSKIMVRVNGKPCLDYIVESIKKNVIASNAILNKIVIVDGKLDDVREYCSIKHPSIEFVKQGALNGPLDAINKGLSVIDSAPNDSLLVWLGDSIVLDEDLPIGEDFLLTKEVDNHASWCMWDGTDFYNKPSQLITNGQALVGVYSFSNFEDAKNTFLKSEHEKEISFGLKTYGHEFKKVHTDLWFDIGELPTYYKTCAELLNMKSRAFNNIKYDSELGVIIKTADYHSKSAMKTLKEEKQWYASLNNEQKMFVPQVFDSEFSLVMSHVSGTLLSDMMLYDNLSESTWEYIINKLLSIKLKYFNTPCDNAEFINNFSAEAQSMWVNKSNDRLKHAKLPLHVTKWVNEKSYEIMTKTKPISGIHGDLHFGNVLYNPYIDQMVFIDPRGQYGNTAGNYGCDIYDFAKLSHDLLHGYNAMVSNVEHNQIVADIFKRKCKEFNLDEELISDAGIVLIATCIVLHYEDPARQERFREKVISYVNSKQ